MNFQLGKIDGTLLDSPFITYAAAWYMYLKMMYKLILAQHWDASQVHEFIQAFPGIQGIAYFCHLQFVGSKFWMKIGKEREAFAHMWYANLVYKEIKIHSSLLPSTF